MKTKIFISIITLLLFSSEATKAQGVHAGIKGGLNVSNLYVHNIHDTRFRPGFNFGLFLNAPVSEIVSLQPEFIFTTAGNRTYYHNNPYDGAVDFNLNYFQIPILLDIRPVSFLDIYMGPYASYLLNANTITRGEFGAAYEELNRGNFQFWDLGLSGGLGLNISSLQLGVRYNLGAKQIANSNSARDLIGASKNSVAQMYLAIKF
ncbi:MAG: porin family protein [Bacteroidia bacterium]